MVLGLFDKPVDKIRKRLPVHAFRDLDDLLSGAMQDERVFDRSGNGVHLALGVVASVWACNSAAVGHFSLNEKDFRFIQNLGANCYRFLGNDFGNLETLLDELMSDGAVPRPPGSLADSSSFPTSVAEEETDAQPAPNEGGDHDSEIVDDAIAAELARRASKRK